jgi:hypothetical protein
MNAVYCCACVLQVEPPYRAAADAEEQNAADAAADAMNVDGEEGEDTTQAGSKNKGKGEHKAGGLQDDSNVARFNR